MTNVLRAYYSFCVGKIDYQEPYEQRLERAKALSQGRWVYTDEELLTKIRTCATSLGRTPGVVAFDRWWGGHQSRCIIDRFGTWSQACTAAGLVPNPRCSSPLFGAAKFSHQDFVTAYQRIRPLAGRPPTIVEWAEFRTADEPTEHSCRKRYGSWAGFLQKMETLLPPPEYKP